MDNSVVNGGLKPEQVGIFEEGVTLILSRWTALQMAIQHNWGGRDSLDKAAHLRSQIIQFFFPKRKEPIYIDDLEDLLFDIISDQLNTVVEDGSIEEVAEEVMILHEELSHDDFKSIEKLRSSSSAYQAVSKSKAVMNEDDSESSSDEESDMAIDEPKLRLDSKSGTMPVDEPKQETVEMEDGWSVVSSKRSKGKRHQINSK